MPCPPLILDLAAGSLAATLGALIVTRGMMYDMGFLISDQLVTNFVSHFWLERRGRAFRFHRGFSGVPGVATLW